MVTTPSGLGHLGAKRDHAHGEGDLILRRTILLLIAIDGVMPRHATKQRTNRATDREPRGSAGQLPQIDIAKRYSKLRLDRA